MRQGGNPSRASEDDVLEKQTAPFNPGSHGSQRITPHARGGTFTLETRKDGEKAMTVLHAVYHGVEHFSMHTGQVLQLVKIRQGVDLKLTE